MIRDNKYSNMKVHMFNFAVNNIFRIANDNSFVEDVCSTEYTNH